MLQQQPGWKVKRLREGGGEMGSSQHSSKWGSGNKRWEVLKRPNASTALVVGTVDYTALASVESGEQRMKKLMNRSE